MPSFLPYGKAGGRQIPRWQGFAVVYYGGTLAALTLVPSDFCNNGVDRHCQFVIMEDSAARQFPYNLNTICTVRAVRLSISFSDGWSRTPMYPCLWVRVYDAFADFKMEMKAKIMSTYTVMNETESPALNKTSLRRWLIEGTLIPMALLPGGPVKWEHVDERRARAIVSMNGVEASLIATFMPDGRLVTLAAEEDGDLNQPYHGSGEHVRRDDYRPIAGMMIPHSFTISRVSKGKIMPFWNGRITAIDIDSTLKEGD